MLVLLATTSTTTTGAATTTSCARPAPATPVTAAPVAGSTTDWSVTSFDGTVIRAHWFPAVPTAAYSASLDAALHPGTHPTVLMGPGWSLPGDTDTDTARESSAAPPSRTSSPPATTC